MPKLAIKGFPCNMDRIMEVAERHGLMVVEDCAHGSEYKMRLDEQVRTREENARYLAEGLKEIPGVEPQVLHEVELLLLELQVQTGGVRRNSQGQVHRGPEGRRRANRGAVGRGTGLQRRTSGSQGM